MITNNETIQCFKCKQHKELNNFKENKRAYQVKAYKGKCLVCIDCDFKRALNDLSVIRFNFEINKFEITKFKNDLDVLSFFWQEAEVNGTKKVDMFR